MSHLKVIHSQIFSRSDRQTDRQVQSIIFSAEQHNRSHTLPLHKTASFYATYSSSSQSLMTRKDLIRIYAYVVPYLVYMFRNARLSWRIIVRENGGNLSGHCPLQHTRNIRNKTTLKKVLTPHSRKFTYAV